MDSAVTVGEQDGMGVSTGSRETPENVRQCPRQVPGWGGHPCGLIPRSWGWAKMSGTMGLTAAKVRVQGEPSSPLHRTS